MSGIAGIIHFDGRPVEPGQVEAMTAALHTRGPDGIHHWRRGNVALGQCMLRTTPESLEETQPLTNEDESLVLVMDGRVDNWEELRRELLGKGAKLRTRADAELVLRAFEVWGRDCLKHIDGDFALLIWNARQQEAFCARDRMGSKPFQYHWNGKTLVFSSELRPIIDSQLVPKSINQFVLAEYLAAEWYSRDETLWDGVMRLVAGNLMMVSSSGLVVEEYWEPDLWEALPFRKDADYIDYYRKLITDSVRRLSRSHRPAAIEVSGGLDSSAIYCVAEQLRRSGRLPAPGIEGFTISFEDDPEANELGYARSVGEYCGTIIHEVAPTRVPLSWFADRARRVYDFPGFVNGTMAQGMLEKASAGGSRAILNGVGGDEWLAGSRAYYAEELGQFHWQSLYACLATDSAAFGVGKALKWLLRHGIFELLPSEARDALRHLVRAGRGKMSHVDDAYWVSAPMKRLLMERRANYRGQQGPAVCRYSQKEMLATRNDAYLALAREEAERLYAESGLEPRRPMHTAHFVQFAFSTPERLRFKGDRDKYIHVQALRSVIPQSICERKTKAQFPGMFRPFLSVLGHELIEGLPSRRRGWLSKEGMAHLVHAYDRRTQQGWPMWALWSIYGCDLFLTAHENELA